jgi:hypothetical protein
MKTTAIGGGSSARGTAPRPQRRGRFAAAAFALGVCLAAASCADGASSEDYELLTASLAQATTVSDCESELASCIQSANGDVGDRAACAVHLQTCLADVVADRVGQNDLLADCRDTADRCLAAAVSATDVRVCKGLYAECRDDVLEEARALVDDAQLTIQATFDTALAAVSGLSGVTGRTVGALRGCRASANVCLDDALGALDVSSCTDIFDACVGGVIDVIDPILDPLPLPGPRQIFDATADCQASAKDCLAGALDALDIRACRDLIDSCVTDARDLVDVVVDEANGVIDAVLPGALDVPGPSEVLDCSGQLLSCLGSATGPFSCAASARDCLLQ